MTTETLFFIVALLIQCAQYIGDTLWGNWAVKNMFVCMSTSKVYKHLKNYQTLIYHIECLRPLIHIPNLIIQFSTMVQEGKLGQNGIAIKTAQYI